jgi:hypothetical protein
MTNTNRTLIQIGLLAALCCSSGILLAQPAEGKGDPRKPPQEALDACKSLSAGQECRFSSPYGTVKGSCWAPEGKPLACKPTDAPADGSAPPKQ